MGSDRRRLTDAVPGIGVITSYRRTFVRPDLLAGLTVWAMLLYWSWGSSRELNLGPESTVAIMVATILAPMAESGSAEHV